MVHYPSSFREALNAEISWEALRHLLPALNSTTSRRSISSKGIPFLSLSGSLPAPRFICLENARIRPSFSLKQNNNKKNPASMCAEQTLPFTASGFYRSSCQMLLWKLPAPFHTGSLVERVAHLEPCFLTKTQDNDNTTHRQPQEEAAIAYKTNQPDCIKQLSSATQSIHKMSSLTSFFGHQKL